MIELANFEINMIFFEYSCGQCAHEYILDLRPFKQHGIVEEDVAKRLQVSINIVDYIYAPHMK